MAGHTQTSAETRLIKAIAHPLRLRILIKLNEGPGSPSNLAGELGEPLGNVSYHVQILLQHGAIELVDTRPVRGAVEHIYRATARPFFDDAHWAKLPVSIRRQFHDSTLQGLWENLVEGLEAGGLDNPRTHISSTDLDLDDQGYDEVAALLDTTLERARAIQAESTARHAAELAEEAATQRTALSLLHFNRPRPGES